MCSLADVTFSQYLSAEVTAVVHGDLFMFYNAGKVWLHFIYKQRSFPQTGNSFVKRGMKLWMIEEQLWRLNVKPKNNQKLSGWF